jgi:hypothetical protein
MDSFQIIVLSIAIIVLILILTVIGIGLKNMKNNIVYPPIANMCPDYWQVAADKVSCTIPMSATDTNSGTIYDSTGSIPFSATPGNPSYIPGYNVTNSTINFSDAGWSAGKTSTCNQKDWATKYNIVWDGVSNYNSC